MTKPLTKKQAAKLYGGSVAQLANALGYTRQAVYAWGNGPIPDRADKMLRLLKPDAFTEDGKIRKAGLQ